MKTSTLCVVSLCVGLVAQTACVQAQYVQNPIGIPIAPGCGAGTTWTKTGAYYTCQSPAQAPPPPQNIPGKTLVGSKSIQVQTDGQGIVGGDNSEGGNSTGSCTAIATVTENDYSDGSVAYSQQGKTVTITLGSQLLAARIPGTCNVGNH